jgi:hypothetical protein
VASALETLTNLAVKLKRRSAEKAAFPVVKKILRRQIFATPEALQTFSN